MNTETIRSENISAEHASEVAKGERFEFGKNWSAFLNVLDEGRIVSAEESICEMLQTESLEGKTFLDIGSGSGLFSLAAKRLGANVFSFDFDLRSVACTTELKRRYFSNDQNWTVEHGSILDTDYVQSLGRFDIVYSWGVLHHTGKMWDALENVSQKVADGGNLFIAIYNDTGRRSERWKWIKHTYCTLPKLIKVPFALLVATPEELKRFFRLTIQGKPAEYFRHWSSYRNARGMNRWHDIIDWVGGYPYEVAGVSKIFDFFTSKGFRLVKLKCDLVGLGCNEFVFQKDLGVAPNASINSLR